ncbi:MucR family transcriptional regulator [Phyllobacterium salinisoli]|uniref:MucR family transcriptional regulator n=1 Tax=Phyllobacterium salinisoli TaxID=1899321 RepID=A0A368K8Z4_9HYPH|nr:MucR family transcriptional regulator [Phyllobacterium salinisoli]RCS25694.1 MucR family transcriptional regulator [Phyllobacterium salinisoli]
MLEEKNTTEIIEFTTEIITAYVSNNSVPSAELPALIAQIHASLSGLMEEAAPAPAEKPTPAVSIKKSITDDYLICLEDGKKFKSLKRHLMTHYGLTPEDYRAKWDLPTDYPMVAPNYAATRSDLAKRMGLGRKAKTPELVKPSRKKAA